MLATAEALAAPADALRLIEGSKVLALDLETTALSPFDGKVRLLSLASPQGSAVLDVFEHPLEPFLPALQGRILVIFNGMFDLSWLWQAGLRDLPETVDPYLLAQLLTAGEGDGGHGFGGCSLQACVHRHLGKVLPKELQTSDWSGPLSADQVEYARRDALVLLPLLKEMEAAIDRAGLQAVAGIELRALPAFVWLAQSGVPFDRAGWVALADRAAAQKRLLGDRLDQAAPPKAADGLFGPTEVWNWDSPQQVGEVLARVGLPVPTTRDAQLALLDHPIAELVRDHRHQAQLVKMYGANWLAGASIRDGRVYPSWRQIGAASGRTSCADPNWQQIPRDPGYRACVVAPPGKSLVKADYATLQMRIACKWARDDALYAVFVSNGDPHTETARRTLNVEKPTKEHRQIAKSQNFGLLFGMSAEGLRQYARMTYGVEFTQEEAEKHRAAWFRAYPGLRRWHEQARSRKVRETRTAAGRRRLLPHFAPDTWRLNSPVQGDEADGAKLALALLWERRRECPSARPVLFCHDEILVEADAGEAQQAACWLEDAMLCGMHPSLHPVPVRVDVKVTQQWGD